MLQMPGAHLTPAELLALLHARQDDAIVGAYETEYVDFKGQYRLVEAAEKWELAKDIAAFANSGGGIIAVGFTTRIDEDRAEECVEAVRPIPPDLFLPKQVHDIAQQWVYPPPLIKVVRYMRDQGALGTIEITPRTSDEPYLVTRMPDATGRLVAQIAFGWPVRTGTQTMWTPVGQVHRHLQPVKTTAERASHVESAEESTPSLDASGLLDPLELEMGWSERAVVYLVATPPPGGPRQLDEFYAVDGVLGAVERPFQLRGAGFGLSYGHRVDTDDSGRIVSAEEERALRIERNGTCVAALAAAPHFLTRGGGSRDPSEPEPRKINPVVLTEWTYLFCHLVATVLAPRVAGQWRLTIGMRGSRSRPWALLAARGSWSSQREAWFSDGRQSRVDYWDETIPASADPGRDAFLLLTALYGAFGLPYNDVGFSSDDAVDAERIRELR